MLCRELIECLKAGSTHDPKNISFYNRNALIKVFRWSLLQNKMICGLNILNIRPYPYTPLYTYVISVVLIDCLTLNLIWEKSSQEAKEKQIFFKSNEPWAQGHKYIHLHTWLTLCFLPLLHLEIPHRLFRFVMNAFAMWPPSECALEDEAYEDGAETQVECNRCVCACGNWVCTAMTCAGTLKPLWKTYR